MEGVIVNKLVVSSSDTRGATYEWMKGNFCNQLTLCYRKRNTISGNHYHTGEDTSKNPEIALLISGKLELITCDGKETTKNILEEAGTEIIIYPNILHTYKAMTDIVFLEHRKSIYDADNNDTFSPKEFESHLKSINKQVNKDAIKEFTIISIGT